METVLRRWCFPIECALLHVVSQHALHRSIYCNCKQFNMSIDCRQAWPESEHFMRKKNKIHICWSYAILSRWIRRNSTFYFFKLYEPIERVYLGIITQTSTRSPIKNLNNSQLNMTYMQDDEPTDASDNEINGQTKAIILLLSLIKIQWWPFWSCTHIHMTIVVTIHRICTHEKHGRHSTPQSCSNEPRSDSHIYVFFFSLFFSCSRTTHIQYSSSLKPCGSIKNNYIGAPKILSELGYFHEKNKIKIVSWMSAWRRWSVSLYIFVCLFVRDGVGRQPAFVSLYMINLDLLVWRELYNSQRRIRFPSS